MEKELEALRKIARTLADFDLTERTRILRYLDQHLEAERKTAYAAEYKQLEAQRASASGLIGNPAEWGTQPSLPSQ